MSERQIVTPGMVPTGPVMLTSRFDFAVTPLSSWGQPGQPVTAKPFWSWLTAS